MKSKDQILLEAAYQSVLKEEENYEKTLGADDWTTQENKSASRWKAIHNLNFLLFGGEFVNDQGKRDIRRSVQMSEAFRRAFFDLMEDGIGRRSDAAKVYALRDQCERSEEIDAAFDRLAEVYDLENR